MLFITLLLTWTFSFSPPKGASLKQQVNILPSLCGHLFIISCPSEAEWGRKDENGDGDKWWRKSIKQKTEEWSKGDAEAEKRQKEVNVAC